MIGLSDFGRMLWVLRSERGETGGRIHHHVLLGGLNYGNVHSLCARIAHEWTPNGFPDFRPYDHSLSGVDYVTKCLSGANRYEIGKFDDVSELDGDESLMVSASVRRCIHGLEVIRTQRAGSNGDKSALLNTAKPEVNGELGLTFSSENAPEKAKAFSNLGKTGHQPGRR